MVYRYYLGLSLPVDERVYIMHLLTKGMDRMSKTYLEKVTLHNHQLEGCNNSKSKKLSCFNAIENPAKEKTASFAYPSIPSETVTSSYYV